MTDIHLHMLLFGSEIIFDRSLFTLKIINELNDSDNHTGNNFRAFCEINFANCAFNKFKNMLSAPLFFIRFSMIFINICTPLHQNKFSNN